MLAPALQKSCARGSLKTHDFKLGGLDQEQKFLDRDAVEYALLLGPQGDSRAQKMVRQDLDGALALLDPVWGGAYQYSTDRDWKHPHFEKLLAIQADECVLSRWLTRCSATPLIWMPPRRSIATSAGS